MRLITLAAIVLFALLDVLRSELGLRLVKEPSTINDFVVERVQPLIEN